MCARMVMESWLLPYDHGRAIWSCQLLNVLQAKTHVAARGNQTGGGGDKQFTAQ